MDAMKDKEALDNYFILLKSILDEHDLLDKPGQIYNVDESGIPLDHRSPRVVTKRGHKKVRYATSGNKSQITKKRKKWSDNAIEAAISSVKEGCFVARAAVEHSVPRTTLNDRISGKVKHGTKPGPVPYLSQEEKDLVDFLDVVSNVGYGKTRKQVKTLVET